MDELVERYQDRVDFIFVYCQEGPHPFGGTVPTTKDERLELARKFRETRHGRMQILVDESDSRSVQKLYGSLQNSAFVIDVGGRVVAKMRFVEPTDLEKALREQCFSGK